MIDYLITEDGTIVKGQYLGTHPEDFVKLDRSELNLIKDSSDIRQEVHELVKEKITELEKQIERERQEVLDWYENNWDSANEWKKQKQIEKTFVIKPGFTEYKLIEYKEVERLLRPRPKGRKTSDRWVDPSLVEKANETPIDSIINFNRGDKAVCLWHNDTDPSLSYHRKGNFAKCFSCGKVASAIDVYMQINNCDFITAVKELTHE